MYVYVYVYIYIYIGKGYSGNLFPLCISTAFKLTFEVSVKKTLLSWIVLLSKSIYNVANIITKHQIISLREKLLELISAIVK